MCELCLRKIIYLVRTSLSRVFLLEERFCLVFFLGFYRVSGLRCTDYSPLAPHGFSGETVDCSTRLRNSSLQDFTRAALEDGKGASMRDAASPCCKGLRNLR